MTQHSTERRARGLVPFAYGFRPFFLIAGWYAVIVMGYWLWLYRMGRLPLPSFPPQLWHGHEMLFGFVTAAIAGFLLTAVPNWTGAPAQRGWPLALLFCLWLLGRFAFLGGGLLPFPLMAGFELAFLPALAMLLTPALYAARNRNLPLLLPLFALWACDAVFLYALSSAQPMLASHALEIALDIVLLLLTIIGGRIVPVFTGNALRNTGLPGEVRKRPVLERFVLVSMIALLLVDLWSPRHSLAALVAAIAGLAHVGRLAGWQGHRTCGQPIVWILHAAYAFLPLGLLLRAAHAFGGFTWAAYWLHALGAGAAAVMIMAVMSRASLGHTGRPLQVAPIMTGSYLLLIVAVLVRVFGPALLPNGYPLSLWVSGGAWIGAFTLYGAVYTPILLRPRVDGKLG